jgi:hypothetical protein
LASTAAKGRFVLLSALPYWPEYLANSATDVVRFLIKAGTTRLACIAFVDRNEAVSASARSHDELSEESSFDAVDSKWLFGSFSRSICSSPISV